MTLGSLFSGIGGLELGLEAAGFGPVLWQVEIDPFCRQVLAKHWPDASRSVTDVRFAGPDTLARVDVLCGGFPCQDVSAAGKRAGLDGARSGLWKEFRRVAGELGPRIIVVENVASGAGRWLCAVREDLHELGYDTAALAVSAEDVGAPHRRARIFVVALAHGDGQGQRQPGRAITHIRGRTRDGGSVGAVADANGIDLREQPGRGSGASGGGAAESCGRGETVGHANGPGRHAGRLDGREPSEAWPPADGAGSAAVGYADSGAWIEGDAEQDRRNPEGPTRRADRGLAESRVGRDPDGLSARLDGHRWPNGRGEAQAEGEPARTVKARTVPDRAARVKSLGNSVVPQCALVVGRWIRSVLP